ncbi:MAG TPA: DNA recombination protein RmuC [Actinomycetota bacterium]|nr:DNA recombination protein RmuC [Actinomycetota bacterium]
MNNALIVITGIGLAAAALWAAVSGLRRVVDGRLTAQQAELRRLADAAFSQDRSAEDLWREVSAVRETIDRVRVREEERRAREDQAWTALQRVSAVLAGSQRAGRAGENVLSEAFAHLPPALMTRDLRVNGRVVEFALTLPDGRRLPIDSKWPAERELTALADCQDAAERDRLTRLIERTVAERAREVSGYRDPALTAPVAVAAVPDAAYAVLKRAHADAYRQGVIVIPYSMALPVVLFLHGIVARFGGATDVQGCLNDLASILEGLELVVENKIAKATTMLTNGADELRAQMGKARSTVARARTAPPTPDLDDEEEVTSPTLVQLRS